MSGIQGAAQPGTGGGIHADGSVQRPGSAAGTGDRPGTDEKLQAAS